MASAHYHDIWRTEGRIPSWQLEGRQLGDSHMSGGYEAGRCEAGQHSKDNR